MPDETVIPLRNTRSTINLVLGALLLLAFAAGGAASVAGVDDQSVGVRVVAGVLGGFCLVGGIGCVVALVVVVQRRDIVVDPAGVHWRTSRGGWTVRWAELAAVAVHTGFTQRPGTRRYARVSLVLQGADAGFFAHHPELLQVRDARAGVATARIPLVDRAELVPPLAHALSHYAGPRFVGVVDDGPVGNLSYRPRGQ